MSLAPFVHAMARGPGRARNLTEAEAETAMSLILSGEAAPEAIGALFMLMRYRGETPGEIAGFVRAMRSHTPGWSRLTTDIDWPSYAAGRSRGLPLFLLSAKLLAQAGHSVCLHGWNSHQNPVADVRRALPGLGIASATTVKSAKTALASSKLVYIPLETLSPRLLELLKLRDVLGLRSPVNTALRTFNPTGAGLSLQGVFHPSYRDLQRDAATLLGQENLRVLKGAGGEFERNPAKPIELNGLELSGEVDEMLQPIMEEPQRMNQGETDPDRLLSLWRGEHDDPFARWVVLGTAAVALSALKHAPVKDMLIEATALWANRHQSLAA